MFVEHVGRLPLDRFVAVRLRARHLHDLAIHLETVHLLYGIQARLLAIEHDEGLAFTLQTALGDYVENGAVVLEDNGKCVFQGFDLDALLKVVDLRH